MNVRSVSHTKKLRQNNSETPVPFPDLSIPHQITPTKPCKLVTHAQKHDTLDSSSTATHVGNIWAQAHLHGHEDGVAVTNNVYLMAMDLYAAGQNQMKDVGSDCITAQINKLLQGHRVSSTTLNEIWMGIYQSPGYEPECWMANLAKNSVLTSYLVLYFKL